MLSEADRAVLDESFQNTRMAGEAIHMVIGKVEDEDLALDLNRQGLPFSAVRGETAADVCQRA